MPLCQGCGTSHDDIFKFCPHCGRARLDPESINLNVRVAPDLNEVRKLAAKKHVNGVGWKAEAFGWPAEYNPEQAEPPLDSKMTYTPADFCIGESGIWLFSLMREHGRDAEPGEFVDDRNLVPAIAEPGVSYDIQENIEE